MLPTNCTKHDANLKTRHQVLVIIPRKFIKEMVAENFEYVLEVYYKKKKIVAILKERLSQYSLRWIGWKYILALQLIT